MHFVLVNQSTRLKADDVNAIAEAVGMQLRGSVAPVWGVSAPLVSVAQKIEDAVGLDVVPVLLLDTPDQPGALGYHSEEQSHPYGRCFVSPVLDNGGGILDGGTEGVSFASVVSHEAIETLLDPQATWWVDATMTVAGKTYVQVAAELGDPVQGVLVPITIASGKVVQLSDFVLPSWFEPYGAPPYDFARALSKPLSLAPGSYVIGRTAGPGSEDEGFAEKAPPAWRMGARGRKSRRVRR